MSKNGNITSPDAEGLITLEHSYNSFDGESNKVNVDVAKGDTLYFYIYRKGTSAGAAYFKGICRVYADLTSTPMLIKSNNG